MLNIYKLKKKKSIDNKLIIKKGEYGGIIKHYPSATKEWFNSIYSYNKNTVKSLPSADLYVTKLIKSYFNLFNFKLEKLANLQLIRLKKRNYNMKKILVGKPEFKHTNDKVIITLFVLNQELVNLRNKINKIKGLKYLNIFINRSILKIDNPKYNLKNKIFIIKKYYTILLKNIKNLNIKYFNNLKYSFFKIEKIPMIYLIRKILINIKLYLGIKKLIHLNKSKFKSIHILPLIFLLKRVYGKNVEFNIINLKRYHFNSSIMTQVMAIKLRNRNNRILRVINLILGKVQLPFKRRLEYPVKESKILNIQNLIIRNNLNEKHFKIIPFINLNNKKYLSKNSLKKIFFKEILDDKLNILLKTLYPKQYIIKLSKKNGLSEKYRKLENTVLDKIKNKVISGIRIEASGRLSKRLIASRAIFKMRQKGSIRNIDSSYKKIPSVLLRGQITSNLNFSKAKDKARIGAFGLKGWVTSV